MSVRTIAQSEGKDFQKLEDQISEITGEMATVSAKLAAAQSADAHAKARSSLDFLETRRRNLIVERMEGESARLQRRIDDVRSSAAEYINPTPALLIERERLRVREDQIEMEIHAAQTALRQQSMAIKAHEGALKTFHEEGAPELRKRLEGLGR